eukprot:g6847.t1
MVTRRSLKLHVINRKREVPRPVAHKACVDGFNAGVASTTALVTQRIESLEEAIRKSLVEGNVAMLKEADTERDTLAEAGREREEEQEEQRKKEQERARKAVEEKSAQVKREKEALSKKQEIETAQAAEHAKREKMKAEEERQARIMAAANAKEETKHVKLDNSAAGAVKPPTSTLEMQTGHAANDRTTAGHKPQSLDQGNDPRDHAGAQKDTAARADGAPHEERQTSVRIGASDATGAAEELAEVVEVPAGEEKGGSTDQTDASRLIEMPDEDHSREVPIADQVHGSRPKPFGNLGGDAGDDAGAQEDATARTDGSPSGEGNTLESTDALDAVGVVEESVEVVPMPAREGKGGNTGDVDASHLFGMRGEGHSQEVAFADQVQGLRSPTPDDDQASEVEPPASTAENYLYARSEGNLAIDLPDDTRRSELLTAEHIGGSEDSLAPRDEGKTLDKLDGAKEPEVDQDQSDVRKNDLFMKLPDGDTRYREVLTADHVEGYESSFGNLDGGQALEDPVAAEKKGPGPGSEDSSFAETQRSVAGG